MGSRRTESGNYRNPCLTMHQPWASLLVYGIKRIEGRSWPAPIRGRLWIHAAGKVPEPETIKAMEDFYREIYATNGITDITFPEHYPVSRLLGCVDVVGCVTCDELVSWEDVPSSVRLEGQTALCWLCEKPQKLIVPFEMRGYQGVYNLERKIYEPAVRGLTSVRSPQPIKFSLPNPRDPFSLKPGSLARHPESLNIPEEDKPEKLAAAIAGARAAATQFSKNHTSNPRGQNNAPIAYQTRNNLHTSDRNSDSPSIASATQFSDNVDDRDKKQPMLVPSRTKNSSQLVQRNLIYQAAVRGISSNVGRGSSMASRPP
ncbi:uncharacterized protein LOC127250082 [Andrographis paniculata]|uniref:uncharacterized protein LOC127250082 n=1 Tax=Andrographis paniculata TaxID=175694 RepID=UPI0021E8F9C8|nr:uncharacterized protein LOC127250082 [Andrographis paniculata]